MSQSDNKFLGEISEVACQSRNDVDFQQITQIGGMMQALVDGFQKIRLGLGGEMSIRTVMC